MERIETECGFMSKAAVSQKIGRLIDMPAAQRECRDAMRIGETSVESECGVCAGAFARIGIY